MTAIKLREPRIFLKAHKDSWNQYPAQELQKVCIDFSKGKIRGTVLKTTKYDDKLHKAVEWFYFEDTNIVVKGYKDEE